MHKMPQWEEFKAASDLFYQNWECPEGVPKDDPTIFVSFKDSHPSVWNTSSSAGLMSGTC